MTKSKLTATVRRAAKERFPDQADLIDAAADRVEAATAPRPGGADYGRGGRLLGVRAGVALAKDVGIGSVLPGINGFVWAADADHCRKVLADPAANEEDKRIAKTRLGLSSVAVMPLPVVSQAAGAARTVVGIIDTVRTRKSPAPNTDPSQK